MTEKKDLPLGKQGDEKGLGYPPSGWKLRLTIGVGTAQRRPSLRTGLADLPHPALRSVVLPP